MGMIGEFNSVCQRYNVRLAFLFGSMARVGYEFLLGKGEVPPRDPYSDLDLGVVFLDREIFENTRVKL